MLSFGNYPGLVPFAYRLQFFLVVRLCHQVHGTCAGERILTIAVAVVIKHLVLRSKLAIETVFNATISLRRDLPFEFKLEVFVLLFSDNIAAATFPVNDAILDDPALDGSLAIP